MPDGTPHRFRLLAGHGPLGSDLSANSHHRTWLYSVIFFTIAQRPNEIGVRTALGAQRGGVMRLILGEAAILVGIGLVVGFGLAVAGTYALSWSFYGVTPRDPLTLAVTLALTMVILAAVGFAASFLSTRRATRVDPMVALRYK